MTAIEKVSDQNYLQEIIQMDEPPQAPGVPVMEILQGIRRRWYIVLGIFLLISCLGVPLVWIVNKPMYRATGAIRVAPIIQSILFSDKDSEGVIPMYQNFMNTQAELMQSNQVLQRVLDELAGKDLQYFKQKKLFGGESVAVDTLDVLRGALQAGSITIDASPHGELIKVIVDAESADEAKIIANAFMAAYMSIEGSRSLQGGDATLNILEDKQKTLSEKIQRQQEEIKKLSEEYGTSVLTGRHDMMLSRVADLQEQLTKIETEKMALEAKVQLFEQTRENEEIPEGLVERKQAFVTRDPTVMSLTQRLAELEERFVVAKQTLAQTNPELKKHEELLEAFRKRLDARQAELSEIFDKNLQEEIGRSKKDRLVNAKAQLEQATIQEKILKEKLNSENAETITLGRKQLAIQEQQEQLELTKELYDAVRRRIQEIEVEQKRPARVSIAYSADSVLQPSKKLKMIGMVVGMGLMAGLFVAFMLGKADRSIRSPVDIIRHIGVPVIGTTPRLADLDKTSYKDQVSHDFQNIRANLGLLSGGEIPNILVVTSAEKSEGKTTFSVNIATNLAQQGKRVILIDGDLRKSDVAHLMQLKVERHKLSEVLTGHTDVQHGVTIVPALGLHVLTEDNHFPIDAVNLLVNPKTNDIIKSIGKHYDHVIIDTPPVLAVPDALLWAKMADAVVLCSLADRSNSSSIKETLSRLSQIGVRVIGNILNNVRITDTYYRYGYDYHHSGADNKHRHHESSRLLLSIKDDKASGKDNA